MADDLTIEFRDDHVHVTLGPSFKLSASEPEELWKGLRTACEENNTRRVLVEGVAPKEDFGTMEVVDAGKRTAAVPNLWLALHFEDFVPDESSELYETIAMSHGVRVKHFSDGEQALTWLRSNAPS